MELEIKNLSKNYKRKKAVKDVNVTLHPGIWGLLGANGAGKTTLMRILAGILEPSNGTVLYCGKDIRSNTQYTILIEIIMFSILRNVDIAYNHRILRCMCVTNGYYVGELYWKGEINESSKNGLIKYRNVGCSLEYIDIMKRIS